MNVSDSFVASIDCYQILCSLCNITSRGTIRRVDFFQEGKKLVRSERYYGKQFRSFTLAHDIDESKAEAEYSDGVLKLTLPKKTGTETKKLTIK